MKIKKTSSRLIKMFLCLTIIQFSNICYVSSSHFTGKIITIENPVIKVSVEEASGCFSVLEKISGQLWKPDPWENAAGLLKIINSKKEESIINLSKSSVIEVKRTSNNSISVKFTNPVGDDGKVLKGVVIGSELILDTQSQKLDIQITEILSGTYRLIDLRYPARHFSLTTDVDRGAGVIPQWQGIICPSYKFPMNGGRFCQWDDATYDTRSVGTLQLYNFAGGLSMPWWGTYNEKSAVLGILGPSSRAQMAFNINNNGQYLYDPLGKMSPNERVLFLDPVWQLNQPVKSHQISYYFIPGGNHVNMAKIYRKVAIERGHFKSLKEKAEANPDVNKLAGAIYMGIYGGYPHYVNMPGMAFTFDRLYEIIKTCHDDLKVENAFIHAWGTFSNHPPECWPISEELGGVSKLKKAVDLAKDVGYLYSSYRAYSPMLENDPNFSLDLFPLRPDGTRRVGGRWGRVDSKYFPELARKSLEKEIGAIGQNADVTDILFIGTPDPGRIELAEYLRSLNLVMGTERGQEQWIPYFDFFEGMGSYYYSNVTGVPVSTVSHKAPLFNLVYHDAIVNYGKIQDPDNESTMHGDFRIKTLRNLLFGNGTLIFISPYEFEGMQDMIKMANDLVSPAHRKTMFEELLSHEYLSEDFQVQRTRFSNGYEIVVNCGPVAQKTDHTGLIPGYGYEIRDKKGVIKSGYFQLSLINN